MYDFKLYSYPVNTICFNEQQTIAFLVIALVTLIDKICAGDIGTLFFDLNVIMFGSKSENCFSHRIQKGIIEAWWVIFFLHDRRIFAIVIHFSTDFFFFFIFVIRDHGNLFSVNHDWQKKSTYESWWDPSIRPLIEMIDNNWQNSLGFVLACLTIHVEQFLWNLYLHVCNRIRFFPNFLDPAEADTIYNDLYHEVPWRQRSDFKNGESFLQPRLTAWYGDFPYSYSGVRHEANAEVRINFCD